ncbi:MAG: NADH-quinone oxidoreductase subunit J family protein [Planctomycetota bacterium]
MVLINQRQPVYAALAMLSLFLGLTGIFTLLDASFVAAMQIMVYGGAVIVIFLFVIMLLNYQPEELPQERETGFKLGVALVCALLAAGLGLLVELGSAREVAEQPTLIASTIPSITRLPAAERTPEESEQFLPIPSYTLTARQADLAARQVKVEEAVQTAKSAKDKAAMARAGQAMVEIESEQDRLAHEASAEAAFGSTKGVGRSLFSLREDDAHTRYSTAYVVPFELLSLLIVAAMLGAVMLAKPRLMDEPVTAREPGAGASSGDETDGGHAAAADAAGKEG